MSEGQVSPNEVAELLRTLHEAAAKLLGDQNGELYPIGASLAADGTMPLLGAHTGDERPDPNELLDMLVGALREQAERGEIRAATVCANVTVRNDSGDPLADALEYRVEGAGIEPFFTYYAYQRRPAGDFEFAEPHTRPAPDRLIFP